MPRRWASVGPDGQPNPRALVRFIASASVSASDSSDHILGLRISARLCCDISSRPDSLISMPGTPIQWSAGSYTMPDNPIIPFIEGDGTGRDIWKASRRVFDAAVHMTSGGKRKIEWLEVLAGEKAFKQ